VGVTPASYDPPMPLEVVHASYGPDAARALHRAVQGHKAGDPLAPVTVLVPTNYVGVSARRLLASGTLGPLVPGTHGVAAVTFLTVYRLGELLGAPSLAAAGRRPVSTPVLAAAVRRVLAKEPGVFGPVREHPATEQALVDAYRELSQVDAAALDALRRTGRRAADVVRVSNAARALLAPDWYDEADLMSAATEAVATRSPRRSGTGPSVLGDLGAVVVHLPQDLTEPAAALLRAVATAADVTVIAGTTGVPRADAGVERAVARLTDLPFGHAAGQPASTDVPVAGSADAGSQGRREVAHGTHVVSASDPDDEVRAAVRLLVEALRDGVPLERMAVLFGASEPYARLVHEQLEAAGIAHNGTAVRTLAQSVLGASLLALLALPDRDFHRHDVMALLASAPVHQRDGRPVPSARWERISRRAGIVRGAAQWRASLDRHIAALEGLVADEVAATDHDPRPEWYQHELDATTDLRAFVDELRDELAQGAADGASWRELAAWAQQLVERRLAGTRRREGWPEHERQAAEKVEAALERLAGLDAVEPAPGLDVFRRALALELDADLGRVGRLGDGVLVGSVALGLGLDLDRVFVCGLVEGTFPSRIRDDSLLPDHDRRATGGALRLRAERVDVDHRTFLAALAAAPTRVLLLPRGDLRRTTERMPSRFVLDTVEALEGTRLYADELATRAADWYTVVPSFTAGIARVAFPATEQEHRLRTLLDHTRAGHDAVSHELGATDVALGRALACGSARASRAFTRFDGNLSGLAVPSPTADDAVVSPTRLEAWASSPFDYFMEQVLRVEIPELPEEIYELSPRDRGSLVHEILDTFLSEVLQRDGGPPRPGEAWPATDRQRLHDIAADTGRRYEAQGLTGYRVFWDRAQRTIRAELDRFLDEDDRVRDAHELSPVATELRFGLPGAEHPAVELPLSDGRVLRFRGAADRVDRNAAGELLVVDYKTGRPREALALQLPVYARAAREAFGEPDTPVVAAYWYISSKHKFKWSEQALTPEYEHTLDVLLRTIVNGIEHGLFPCVLDEPGAWTRPWRTYADPDARGTRDRWREWERKKDAPELSTLLVLDELAAAMDGSEAS